MLLTRLVVRDQRLDQREQPVLVFHPRQRRQRPAAYRSDLALCVNSDYSHHEAAPFVGVGGGGLADDHRTNRKGSRFINFQLRMAHARHASTPLTMTVEVTLSGTEM